MVWNAEYLAFGTRFGEKGGSDFEEWHGFTGKEYDPDTGLYYNARWYDSDIGRFISEDPARDPNNPNLYVYGRNNPLGFVDMTGTLTLAVGGNGAAAFGIRVGVQGVVAGDSEGQIGIMLSLALGGGTPTAGGSVVLSITTAKSIGQLRGLGLEGGVSVRHNCGAFCKSFSKIVAIFY